MQWVRNGSRLGNRGMNVVGTKSVTPGLPRNECSGYEMGQVWVTEDGLLLTLLNLP